MEKNATSTDRIYSEEFLPKVHLLGRTTNLLAVVLCLLPPLYLSFVRGFHPGWSKILTGFVLMASSAAVYWFMEPMAYFPVFGPTGTYMAFLSGNISNQRVPCALAAQSAVQAEPGSKKAEMAAILGIAASIVVNLIVLLVLVVAGVIIVSKLPPSVTASFDYVLPGVFGGMLVQSAIRTPQYAAFSLPLAIVLNLIVGLPTWVKIPFSVFASICFGVYLHNKKKRADTA